MILFGGECVVILGLCGGTGSGKSTVAISFLSFGVPTLDADAIYRELTTNPSDCLLAIREVFGDEVVIDGKTLDRKALGEIVFQGENADEKRALLNSITHIYVKEEIERRIALLESEGKECVLLDVPLLFESGIDKICDFLICVTAPVDLRIERLLRRDNITRETALARIRSQLSDEYLIANTDFHIENNTTREQLHETIKQIIDKINIKVGTENG